MLSLLLGGPYLLATLWGAAILVKSEVIADAKGLHWRKTGAWSEARWADVTDYCDSRQPSTKQTSRPQADTVWVQVKTRTEAAENPAGSMYETGPSAGRYR